MKWIGLTGGIATGKSTASALLRDLGLPVVDADILAREVVKKGSPGLEKLVGEFGAGVLLESGELDRKNLGRLIFESAEKRNRLEEILHPRIQELRGLERRRLEKGGNTLAFYDVPLLFEKNLQDEFDATLLVYSDVETQKQRLIERDALTALEVDQRLESQLPIEEKKKLANYVVFNNSSIAELKKQLAQVVLEIQS